MTNIFYKESVFCIAMVILSLSANSLEAQESEPSHPSQLHGARSQYREAASKEIHPKEMARPKIKAPEKNEERPQSDDTRTIWVSDVKIVGNSAFETSVLYSLISDRTKKNLTFNQIQDLAATIEKYYNDEGYQIVKVFLPNAAYKNGILTIEVLEGRLGEVRVTENSRYRESMLRSRMEYYLTQGKMFKFEEVERPLVLLNSYPALQVQSVLTSGKKVGTTDIIIKAKEEPLLAASLEFNNFGSESSGEYRLIPHIALRNPYGWGDQLSFYAAIAMDELDSWSYQVDYNLPISSFGTSLALYYGQGNNAVGNEFEILDILGDSDSWGFGATQLHVISARTQLKWELMFDAQNFQQSILGQQSIDDSIRKLRVGLNVDYGDSSGRTFASAYIHQGLGEMLGGMENDSIYSSRSFSGADNDFTKFVISAVRLQSLGDQFSGVFSLTGQFASDSLVSSEQIYLGGANSVRGQPYSTVAGDDGFVLNVELRYSLFEGTPSLQIAAFFDAGAAHTKKTTIDQDDWESAAGYGIGVRSELCEGLDLRLDLGLPVGEKHGDDAYFYGQIRYQF